MRQYPKLMRFLRLLLVEDIRMNLAPSYSGIHTRQKKKKKNAVSATGLLCGTAKSRRKCSDEKYVSLKSLDTKEQGDSVGANIRTLVQN